MDVEYTLGIDGGGSKTDAVILDDTGKIVGAGIAGGCNVSFTPRRSAAAAYRRAIRAALKEAKITSADISKAGCTFGQVAKEVFQELGFTAQIQGMGEHEVAFERAGIIEQRGVSLIAGTGSSCVARDVPKDCEPQSLRNRTISAAGGWGPLLGDDGSGYDIGLRGIKRALLATEGRAPETLLEDSVKKYFEVEWTKAAINKLCKKGVSQSLVAGFAPYVSRAAYQGDEAAIAILESAGETLGELAAFVARRAFTADDEFPFVLAGGVFNIGRLVLDPIKAVLKPQFPNARMVIAEMRPGEAVARLIMKQSGGKRCL